MLAQDVAKRDSISEYGVVDAYIDTFAAQLAACGYARGTIQSQLKLLELFNEWLIRRRCAIHQLNDELVAAFLKRCTRRGRIHRGDAHTLRQFHTHLRTRGA